MDNDPGSRPNPDPTVRTNEDIQKAVDWVTSVFDVKIEMANSELLCVKELFQTQLRDRDSQVRQVKEDGEKALSAALAAQKEAVGKTEFSFTKEIDSLRREISDLKDRLNNGEGVRKGTGDVIGWIMGAAGLVIAALALLFHH